MLRRKSAKKMKENATTISKHIATAIKNFQNQSFSSTYVLFWQYFNSS